ncbi:hypothetical protein MVEN_01328400 [Mycena venus]|uniref:Uncharacterized protein n=1 Tax=Mycena venus TaxID=2733690 RepID=A0A8H6Y0P1_9AGAR|nr:hypothetical protein MVEN_01328400 [Mycena venus]
MPAAATFWNLAISTTFDINAPNSMLSLDWVLQTGVSASRSVSSGILTVPCGESAFSVQMELSVASSLPFDVVLGRDWLQYCRKSVPSASFHLSSGRLDVCTQRVPACPADGTASSDSVSDVFPQFYLNVILPFYDKQFVA